MGIENGFDKRTSEGKRNFAINALLDFAYKDNIDVELEGNRLPDHINSLDIKIPNDGAFVINEEINYGSGRVEALRVTIYDSEKRVYDVCEVPISEGSQFDKYIKEKREEKLKRRKEAFAEFFDFAQGNLDKILTPDHWEEQGKNLLNALDLPFTSLPDGSDWSIKVITVDGKERINVTLKNKDEIVIDAFEFSKDPDEAISL